MGINMNHKTEGWLEAVLAWEVCASLHREYAKGKDPFFSTRQADFQKHIEKARQNLEQASEKPSDAEVKAAADALVDWIDDPYARYSYAKAALEAADLVNKQEKQDGQD